MDRDRTDAISRVPASKGDIRKSYGLLSRWYGLLEGGFEKGIREKGLELLAVEEGEVVLEIGVGTGFSLREIARSVGATGRAHGLDLTPEMLRLTEKRLRRAQLMARVKLDEGDARAMPYQNHKFNAVYLAATLELFDTPDIPRVLGEVRRVLKPGGRLGAVSMSKEGRENHWFGQCYEWLHQKFPRYASCRPIYLEQSLREAGFDIVESQEYLITKIVPMRLVLATPG
jgi:demethylmenaquinone methyltransferase/2-methoxy-6-polyprenyl-1,4-benzoquinol methylase